MRRIVCSVLFCLLSCLLFSQECNDDFCRKILELQRQNESKDREIYSTTVKINNLTNQYEALQKISNKDEKKIKELDNQISSLNESKRALEADKLALDNQLKSVIEELKQQKVLTALQKKLIEKYEKENSEYERDKRDYDAETKQITFENSYFSNVELGYSKNGKIYFSKVVENGKDISIDPRLWSNRLNTLRISGKTYIPIVNQHNVEELHGKLLIYANNQLVETIDYKLTDKSERRFYNHYEIDKKIIELSNKIPEGADIKVAFVDDKTYQNNYEEIFNSFWIAQNKGLLTMASLKPQNKTEALTIEKILETSISRGLTIRTFKHNLTVKLFDNGEVDNDRADFYVNKTKVISNLLIVDTVYKQPIELKTGLNKFTLVALDVGQTPPCTVTVQVYDGEKFLTEIILKGDIGYSESVAILVEER